MRQTGLNESFEERMRLVGLALKFRMILASEKIRMIAQLYQFRQSAVLLGSTGTEIEQLTPLLPASLRLIQKRRGRILVPPQTLRKGFVKRLLMAREEYK